MRQVTQELSLAKALYARHPGWTVLDVTHKGVEETAARIMKDHVHQRKRQQLRGDEGDVTPNGFALAGTLP